MTTPKAHAAVRRWEQWHARLAPVDDLSINWIVGRRKHRYAIKSKFGTLFVQGRDGLNHVGKVTEKSAAFMTMQGNENWRCKCDDDTLVHLPRLKQALSRIDSSKPAFFGYIKWRGWEADGFRACAGVWGNAKNVLDDFAKGECKMASGPFPYAAGAMYCLSKPARQILRTDSEFARFRAVAWKRNTKGMHNPPCRSAKDCAAQDAMRRMWHHEDAGIAFNLWRAVVRRNETAFIVRVPGHYNDPGPIELDTSLQAQKWSMRSIFVHNIKTDSAFQMVDRWKIQRPLRLGQLLCARPSQSNTGWLRARLPCEKTMSFTGKGERLCPVDPDLTHRICGWKW